MCHIAFVKLQCRQELAPGSIVVQTISSFIMSKEVVNILRVMKEHTKPNRKGKKGGMISKCNILMAMWTHPKHEQTHQVTEPQGNTTHIHNYPSLITQLNYSA